MHAEREAPKKSKGVHARFAFPRNDLQQHAPPPLPRAALVNE